MNVLLFHNVSLSIFFPNRIVYNTNRNGNCSGYHTQFKLKREALLNIFWRASRYKNNYHQNSECNLYLKMKLEY